MISALAAFGVAAVLGSAVRWAGPRVGAMDRPGGNGLKSHARAVPWLGGLAVAAGMIAGLVIEGWPLPGAATVAIAGALTLGLADDAFDLPAWTRLAVQCGLGLLIAAAGLAADALPGAALAWIGAVVLVAAALNAVNMVDGMDGLAGATATLTALGLALAAARAGHDGAMVVALVTAGATLGFLTHNLPPAHLFLGDNGAYLLGATLAVVVLAQGHTVAQLLGGATCLGLFVLDLLLAILRRAVGGAPITGGDRGHIYDQLRSRGLGQWGTLGVCGIVHLALVAVGVRISSTTTATAVATTAVAWVVVAAWLVWAGLVTGRGGSA